MSKDVRTTVTSKWVVGGNGELRDAFPMSPWMFLTGKYAWWVITHPLHVGVTLLTAWVGVTHGLLAAVGVLLLSGVLYVCGVGLIGGRGVTPPPSWRERLIGVWRLWRLQRLWPSACEAGGVLTRRGGGALPLKRRRIEPHGLTFLVRNGKGGRTVGAVRAGSEGIAAVMGCDSISVREESAALCAITLSWGDPTTQVLTFADLPGSPFKYAAFGVDRDGQAASLATYLSVLICGLPGSGKSSLVWAYLAGLLRDRIPFGLTVIDPAGGVEMHYLKDSPLTKKYVDKISEVAKAIDGQRDAMRARLHDMQSKGIRFHEPTAAEPLRILIIDELLLLGDMLQKGANSPLGEILSTGRKAGYLVIGLSQLSQVDALGRIRDLFPQRVCLATKSREMTEAVLGPGAEAEGARCSKITEAQAGVGYLLSGVKRAYIRFRSILITDDEARMIAEGKLPSTEGMVKAPNAAYQVLRKKKTAVYWYYSIGDGRLIYVGIAVKPNERMPEHKKDWWWSQVDDTRTELRWYKDRDTAKRVETDYINRYHPDGNDQENVGQEYEEVYEGEIVP